MSKELSFEDPDGRTISGRFEVRNGIMTVAASDGRTRVAEIEDGLLRPETLARTLLFQLHRNAPENE